MVSSSGITGYHNIAKVKGPGVVTGRYGTLGQVHYIEEDYWPLNTALYVEDFKGNNPRFVAYLLSTLQLGLQNAAGAVPGLNRNTLHQIQIKLPSPDEQESIAGTLANYDDLIDNNLRRIKLLEEAAQLIYKEWFVHLRFPGAEHCKISDGVPNGWKRVTLEEATCFLNRGISPSYDDEGQSLVINQKCIRDGLLNLEPARRQKKEFSSERQVNVGDVLINSTGAGTLGRVAMVRRDVLACTVDTHVTIARPAPEASKSFFGLTMMCLEPVLSQMGIGATNQTELTRNSLKAMVILLPPPGIQAEFEDRVWPMLYQTTVLQEQNTKLREARDLLLPRLMSGEIEV